MIRESSERADEMTVVLPQTRGWRRRGRPASPEGTTETHRVPPVTLLERVSDALFSLDREWRFAYVNTAAESLFAARREELLGQSI